ncbi:hypothetical protein MMC16_003867 [Acarospora aff. strigata]|nr:hypothetical protein [Acarospora aff. strigata]
MLSHPRFRLLVLLTIGAVIPFFLLITEYQPFSSDVQGLIHQKPLTRDVVNDVFNKTLGFEKIFVINLPARTDHRDGIALAAAVSDMSLNWVDGVNGESVLDKVLPPGMAREHLNSGGIGSWRAHLNAILTVVQQNLSTALIFEDDVDWDVRIRSQLRDFAFTSQALIQPLFSDPSIYPDPTYPAPNGDLTMPPDMNFDCLPSVVAPSSSPYGDGWDVLWLGHCGARFPNTALDAWAAESKNIPKG